jgi:single-strand DNA-binding protein
VGQSYNRTIVVGTLGSDPQVKFLPGGTAVCEVSLACNRQWTDKSTGQKKTECDWIPVTLFGRTAEILGEFSSKGATILVEGRLQMDSWDDRESGQKRSKLKVIGETMQLLGSRKDSSSEPRQDRRQDAAPSRDPQPQSSEPDYGDSGPQDEVPF